MFQWWVSFSALGIERLCIFMSNSVDKILHPIHIVKASDNINESGASKLQQECTWGNYAKGALYALQSRGNVLTQVSTSWIILVFLVTVCMLIDIIRERNKLCVGHSW